MTEVTTPSWTKDLSPAAVKAASAKAESIDQHIGAGNKEYGKAALDLELVHRHYLKGDKARLVSFCEAQVRGIKASMAYVYVQAGRVLRNPQACGLDKATAEGMAVQALAILDRFLVPSDAEAQAEATSEAEALISANKAEAEASGTKALTAEGLRESVKALRESDPEAEATDPTDRKVGNIAGKLRDSLPLAILMAEGVRVKDGDLAAGFALAAWVADNAQYGPLTGQAIVRLATEAKADKAKAEAAARKDQAKADRIAAAVSVLTPSQRKAETAEIVAAAQARSEVRGQVTEAPKAKATPKRRNRKAIPNNGLAAQVAAQAPAK